MSWGIYLDSFASGYEVSGNVVCRTWNGGIMLQGGRDNRVVNNVFSILAIELLTAAQALHFRRPLLTSPQLEKFVNTFRSVVPFMETDRLLHEDIVKAEEFCKNTRF